MEQKTIYTKHDYCVTCRKWTPHYVQHEATDVVNKIKTVTYKTSCILHEKQALKETKKVHESIFILLMADKLKPLHH